MTFRHTRRSPGCRSRSGPKDSWQMRSQVMAGRNGLVSSARRRMCGPRGVAGSRRVCKPNMSRRYMRRVRSGIQVHRPRVAKKSGSVRSRKKSRGCGPKLSCSASSKETGRVQRSWANRQRKEVARKKDARWTLKGKQTVRRSWISKRKACSGSCGKLRSARTCLRLSETSRRRHGRRSWRKSREKGQSFCRSIRKFRRGDKKCKACGISTGTSSKRLERVKKKCKRSVTSRRKRKADYETRFPVLSERSGDSRKAAAELDIEIQSFLGKRRKKRQQCFAIKLMLLRPSHVGVLPRGWRSPGNAAARVSSGRSQQSIW